jgi:hypothetical protein
MTVVATKTIVWSQTTPNDGDFFEAEFNRIYSNTNDLQSQVTGISAKSISLGAFTQDDFDFLDSTSFPLADATAVLRADFNSSLLAKLLKNVTSLTPGTDRVNIVGHGLSDGQKVKFGFTGGGITALTEYYVRNKTTDDFQLSTTPSGGILDLTSDQTGEMLANVAWGFGNGSTTVNVPLSDYGDGRLVSARYYTNASTTTRVTDTLAYQTKDYDSHNAYDIATGVYTCPFDGIYSIAFQDYFAAPGSIVDIYKNGSLYLPFFAYGESAFTGISTSSVKCLMGDTIELRISAGTLANPGANLQFFEITRNSVNSGNKVRIA